ncbi:hypothetical protein B0T24DRAFT_120609 [Lasiosphaeria ovina]|uniref:Nephrocystin 3-like N-terminal domain-containing protein n=1 Tax=Lasiosphaeria ovina TaxID=92902 RepID=A0AAE0JSE2_9PEZI|nr:hypothetical protein B0T24DRAFT_120609 [Lasiosphaeria ovina]
MDPLSLTASVIAVVQLAGSCLNLSKRWLGPSEFNSADLAAIATTLHQFVGAIETFQRHLEKCRDDEARLSSLQYLSPVLKRCTEALAIVEDFIQKNSFLGKHVIGPRFDRKLKASLRALEAARELFQFTLHADNSAILFRVDQYIHDLAGDIRDLRDEVTTGLERLQKRLHENTDEICREIKRARGEQDIVPTAHPTSTVAGQSTRVEKPSLNEEQKRELLGSLRFDQIDARQTTIKNAHVKTCKWLLKKHEYLDWLDPSKLGEHHGFLWIKGKPGAGKSTLMKFALADARKKMQDKITISFFFNARGDDLEKSTTGMYQSLLLQLFERVPAIQDAFDSVALATWHGGHHQWSIESLKSLFEQAIQSLGKLSLACFIDALDECVEHQIRDMISFFEYLGELTTSAAIQFRVCFSSRHYPHITIAKGLSLILEGQEGHSQDIVSYLSSELKIGRSNLAEQIRIELQEKSSGVFMWVVLVVGILNKEHDGGRIHALRQRLRDIPGDLHELFRDILRRDHLNRGELLLCIQWVLFARQPLKPEQLYFAILAGIEPQVLSEWDPDEITATVIQRFILDSSKGLAEITKSKSPTVQFIHDNFEGESHERLKQCCLSQLYIDITTPLGIPSTLAPASSEESAQLRHSADNKFPFLEYATRNILYHTDSAEAGGINQLDFLHSFRLTNWIELNNLFERHDKRRYTSRASFLYLLGEHNAAALIRVHPSNQACLAVESERYGTPMFAALATGSKEAAAAFVEVHSTLQPLLSELRNAFAENRNKCLRMGRSFTFSQKKGVLSFVLEQEDEGLLALYIATEHANVKDQSLLSCAAQKGYEVVVRQLLDRGADVEAKDKSGWTPLLRAIEYGQEAIVRQLLDRGADVEAKDDWGQTPLSWAAGNGHETIVLRLLDLGADVEAKDNYGRTPLSWAAGNGHKTIVRQLLNQATDSESKSYSGRTPLSWAAQKGRATVGNLPLGNKTCDPSSKDRRLQTPLIWAAANGQYTVVELLLTAENVDYDWKDDSGRASLSWAAANGHEAVIKLLLATGRVDVNSRDNNDKTPLLWTATQVEITTPRHGKQEAVDHGKSRR